MRHLHLILAVAAVAALACSGDDNPSSPTDGGDGTSTVTVGTPTGGLVFSPTSINVPLNGTVTWNWNSGGVVHDVTFPDGSSGSKSSGTFQKTFPTAGTFTYFCKVHGAAVMSGSVVVGSSTGGTGGGGGGGGAYP